MRVGLPRTAGERAGALACLLGAGRRDGTARVSEAISLAESGTIDLSGLIGAWNGDEPVGASLWCRTGDGSAFVWPPDLGPDGRPADAVALLEEVIARCRAAGCSYAQSAIEPERSDHADSLRSVGFRLLTDLLFLKRNVTEPLPAVRPLRGRLVSYSESSSDRFAELIERTYAASDDCPGFHGFRSASEALRSYESAGRFTPERWRLVEQAERDVAVILVNEHDERAREIVYLGAAPDARRQGLGRTLIGLELEDARRDGFPTLVTAADANNVAAVTLYSRMGFFPGERKSIYLIRLAR